MALADYFGRNAQAASALVQGFDAALLAARLESEVIGIAVDNSVEASFEGKAAVDLAVRLLARLYPSLVIASLDDPDAAFLDKLHALARSINPKIDSGGALSSATKVLVFGNTKLKARRNGASQYWYVGSDNWNAHLSMSQPVGSGASKNPFGAGIAACVAAANVFRAVFQKELGASSFDTKLETSVWDLRPATAGSANPVLRQIELDDVHLVGAGAIGHGALWVMSNLSCSGTLHVVDAETITDSNLQRYVMATAADKGKVKAELARTKLRRGAALSVVPHVATWAEHIAQLPEHKATTVLSAVDSAKSRIEIQASLPRRVFNAWTQRGEAGVSRHPTFGKMACLACLYLPDGQVVNEDVLVTRALKLPEEEQTVRDVRRRLQCQAPTERGFIEKIAACTGVAVEKLIGFEGRPLRDLYVEAVCGGQVMEFHQAALEAKAEVPMGFQSAMAGILLVAELARGQALQHTVTQIDLLGTFPESPGTPKAKRNVPQCICLDDDFLEVYRNKYPDAA